MLLSHLKNLFAINKTLLPIKIHYFFLFGGAASTLTFFPLIAKSLGFNAAAVGIIYTLIPFFNLLAKVVYGYIADFFRNIKLVIVALVVAATSFSLLILLVPALDDDSSDIQVATRCVENSTRFYLKSKTSYSELLPKDRNETLCYLTSSECLRNRATKRVSGYLSETRSNDFNLSVIDRHNGLNFIFLFDIIETEGSQKECDCLLNKYVNLDCGLPTDINASRGTDCSSVYNTYNFWLLLALLIVAISSTTATFCLSDAACYEILGEQPLLFGRQRLWGTVSWGIAIPIVGYFNDFATGDSPQPDYSPVFYSIAIFMVIDLAVLYRIHLEKSKVSKNILKDTRKVFSSYKTLVFAVAIYICGALNGFVWHYQFWYLLDLGASQILLGLVTAVQCLASEIPFLFYAGWLIKKLGHFNSLIMVFLVFSIRLGLHAALSNPWYVLLVELLHGVAFALPFATVTDYAAHSALPGTEATTMGILAGIFEGFGVATGSLLGGIGYDRLGGSFTFFMASMISLVCVPLLTTACLVLKWTDRLDDNTQDQSSKKTESHNDSEIKGIKL